MMDIIFFIYERLAKMYIPGFDEFQSSSFDYYDVVFEKFDNQRFYDYE